MMFPIRQFKEIVHNYRVVFFDAFGVLKTHAGLIDGIENTFRYLKKEGIDFYVLTNDASRGPKELADYYQKLGVVEITENKIISSGMLAREYLSNKLDGGTVAYLGTAESAHYIETAGCKTLPIGELDLAYISMVKALVLLDDEGFNWQVDINKMVNLIRKLTIPVILANTDVSYPENRDHIAIAIGGIADMIEDILGRTFIRFGKPDAQMFLFAYEHLLASIQVDKREILMVGDTLQTDILGGNKFGLDTALVLSGNTLEENAEIKIRSSGIIPDYICPNAVIT